MNKIRVGHGYDIHRLENKPTMDYIKLGGVKIPYERGLVAHSDGDVALHAICDALLGALAMGDIGQHFPDTDPAFKNMDSRMLLAHVMAKVTAQQYQVSNLDVTIIAQAPRLAPYIQAMRATICEDLKVDITAVNVKATTHEKLDAVGAKQGIAVHAVVLIDQQ